MTTMKEYMQSHGLTDQHVCLHFENGRVFPERAVPRYPPGIPVRIGGGIFIAEGYGSEEDKPTIMTREGKSVTLGVTRLFPFDEEVGRDFTIEDYKRVSRCTYSSVGGDVVVLTNVKMHNGTPRVVMPQLPTFPFMTSCSRCGCLIPFSEEMGAGWDDNNGGRLCGKCHDAPKKKRRRSI